MECSHSKETLLDMLKKEFSMVLMDQSASGIIPLKESFDIDSKGRIIINDNVPVKIQSLVKLHNDIIKYNRHNICTRPERFADILHQVQQYDKEMEILWKMESSTGIIAYGNIIKITSGFWYEIVVHFEFDSTIDKFNVVYYSYNSLNGRGCYFQHKSIVGPLTDDEVVETCKHAICDEHHWFPVKYDLYKHTNELPLKIV